MLMIKRLFFVLLCGLLPQISAQAYELLSIAPEESKHIDMQAEVYYNTLDFSADGRFVTFMGHHNAYGYYVNRGAKVYRRDRVLNQTVLASVTQAGAVLVAKSPQISDDGQIIVFNNYGDIYVYDHSKGYAEVIAHRVADGYLSLSADGKFLAYGDGLTKRLTIIELATNQTKAEIADVAPYFSSFGFSLSKEGKRIAYNRARQNSGSSHWYYDSVIRDLTTGKQVTFDTHFGNLMHNFSDDGLYFIISMNHGQYAAYPEGKAARAYFGKNGVDYVIHGGESGTYVYHSDTGATEAISAPVLELMPYGSGSGMQSFGSAISPNGRYQVYNPCSFCHMEKMLSAFNYNTGVYHYFTDYAKYNYGAYFMYDRLTGVTRLIKDPTPGRAINGYVPFLYGVDNNGTVFLGANDYSQYKGVYFAVDGTQEMEVTLFTKLQAVNTHQRAAL